MAKKPDSTLVSGFLQSIVDVNISLHEKVYDHCSILIVISGLILTISLTQLATATFLGKIGFTIIAITCGLSAITCLFIIRPKASDNPLNRMYYGGVLKIKCEKDYVNELKRITKDKDEIIEHFAREVYDLAPILRYKYRLVKTVVDIFVIGLVIGAFVIFLGI